MKAVSIGAMSRGKWQPIRSVASAVSSHPHLVPDPIDRTLQEPYKMGALHTKSNGAHEPHLQLPNAYRGSDAFAKLLSDSIFESMTDLLGIRVREAVYDFMERKYSVARNEIVQHLDQLFTLFDSNFGVTVRKVISRAFVKKVYSKLEWEFLPIPNFEFADYIDTIKTRIARELQSRAKSVNRTGF